MKLRLSLAACSVLLRVLRCPSSRPDGARAGAAPSRPRPGRRLLSARRRVGEEVAPPSSGMDRRRSTRRSQFAQTHETEARDGLHRSGAHLRHAAGLGAEHPRADQRRRHLQGLRRRRVRRHDLGRSRPTRWPRACCPPWPASPCATARCRTSTTPVGRTVKDGGYDSPRNSLGHLEDAPAAGERVGRQHVRQEGRLHRQGGVRRGRDEAARAEAAGHLLRIQRRAHQPLRRCRCCAPSRSRCPTCSATR